MHTGFLHLLHFQFSKFLCHVTFISYNLLGVSLVNPFFLIKEKLVMGEIKINLFPAYKGSLLALCQSVCLPLSISFLRRVNMNKISQWRMSVEVHLLMNKFLCFKEPCQQGISLFYFLLAYEWGEWIKNWSLGLTFSVFAGMCTCNNCYLRFPYFAIDQKMSCQYLDSGWWW